VWGAWQPRFHLLSKLPTLFTSTHHSLIPISLLFTVKRRQTVRKRRGKSPAKMALHAPIRLQATKTSPPPSLLAPNGNNVGLKGPTDRFALKSSFFSPSLHLLIASYNQQQPLASAAPRFSMRAATKQAYICRDCGYYLFSFFLLFLARYWF